MCCQGAGFACSICFSPENAGRLTKSPPKRSGSETGTLRWYARFYARACRNWALSTLCTGGLFITGGIALRNPLVTECAAFPGSLL
ncbi:MAG: glucokinase [Bilophila wadsworthia]